MNSLASRKIFVLGLDGGTLNLVEPWIKEGRLPNFAKLFKNGSYGILKSTMQPLSPPAWASFQTGTNPGKHGVFDFYKLQLQKKFKYATSKSIDGVPFWELLSERGRTVGLVNVPFTHPVKALNGYVIAGFPCYSNENLTYPSNLYKQIKSNVGMYKVDIDLNQKYRHILQHEHYIRELNETVDNRIRTLRYLLERQFCNVNVVVFTTPDRAQNVYWKFSDPQDTRATHMEKQKYGNVILDIYQKIDQFLGYVQDQLCDNDAIVVLSDHGFGPMHDEVNLNRWLVDNGYLYPQRQKTFTVKTTLIKTLVKSVMPKFLWSRFRKISQSARVVKTANLTDWSRSKAYTLGDFGNIFVNLKGREPNGIVEPGQEYEAVCEDIITALTSWRNSKTGNCMVKKAYKRKELYSGPHTKEAPDIVIEWEDYKYHSFRTCDYNKPLFTETATGYYRKVGWSGNHTPDGMVLIKGPGVKQGNRIGHASIMDIAPTLLYLAGESIPDHMDGKVIEEAFEAEHLKSNPPKRYTYVPTIKDKHIDYFKGDTSDVEEQLKALGYI